MQSVRTSLSHALSRERRVGLLAPAGVLALALLAYRPLVLTSLKLPAGLADEVERWFFEPDQFSPLFVLGLAGWLLYRRAPALLSLPARSDPLLTALGIALGAGCFVWAHLTRAPELLLPSLGANLLAFAAAARGRAGCRRLLLPALVLLLGIPIPAPLRDEIVWQLQLATAGGMTRVMRWLGQDVVLGGVLVRGEDSRFLVIDACSGLRGMQTLTLLALAVRELFRDSGARQWLVVVLAPALGYVLNVVRVVLIAMGSNPEAAGGEADHTPQGVAVLLVGTAILYALGGALAGRWPARERPHAPLRPGSAGPLPRLGPAAAWLGLLAVLSFATPAFPETSSEGLRRVELPEAQAGWTSEQLELDVVFRGAPPWGQYLYRRYRRPVGARGPLAVDAFLAYEVPGNSITTRLFSSKIARPGSDWSIEARRPVRLWVLDRDAEEILLSRPPRADAASHALAYIWRVHDRGLWRETLRRLLALQTSPFRSDERRAVVRLATPLGHSAPDELDRGKQVLDRFVRDFRAQLAAL